MTVSMMPAPKPAPANDETVDAAEERTANLTIPDAERAELRQAQIDADLAASLGTQHLDVGNDGVGRLLDQEAFGQPKHSDAYMVARGAVRETVEHCDTKLGAVAQWVAPPVAAVCASARVIDHLDMANDSRLMGLSEGMTDSLIAAGREALPLSPNKALRRAGDLADAAEIVGKAFPDAKQGGDNTESIKSTLDTSKAKPAEQIEARGPSAGFLAMLSGKQAPEKTQMPTPFDRHH